MGTFMCMSTSGDIASEEIFHTIVQMPPQNCVILPTSAPQLVSIGGRMFKKFEATPLVDRVTVFQSCDPLPAGLRIR